VIGYVGEAGLSTGPALYFEIRKGMRTGSFKVVKS
jgi:murein DD-endopeptidase MepM/ murein hydrolase activator NlpD